MVLILLAWLITGRYSFHGPRLNVENSDIVPQVLGDRPAQSTLPQVICVPHGFAWKVLCYCSDIM